MKKTIEQLQSENIQDVIENGPSLRYSRNTWIIAKDSKNKKVLVGGLGAMGVGQMWFDEDDNHKTYEGYETAKEVES